LVRTTAHPRSSIFDNYGQNSEINHHPGLSPACSVLAAGRWSPSGWPRGLYDDVRIDQA
jgi:hypothetical protein